MTPRRTIETFIAQGLLALALASALGGCKVFSAIIGPSARSREDARVEAAAHYMQGFDMENAGDLAGALEEYEKAHRLDPASATVSARLGIVLYLEGRRDEAAPLLAAGEKAAPTDAHIAFALARFFAETGRNADTLKMCKYAEADPLYRFDAMKIEAELLLQTGETEAARKTADALAQQRGLPGDWLLLADALQADRKPLTAAEALLHAADSDPTAAIRASQLYALGGNYARATEVIRRYLSVVPPLADLSKVPLGLPQVPRRDIEPWDWRVSPTPLGVERSAYVCIAWIALAHRNHAAARAALLESIEETGEYLEAYEFLGDVSVDAGDIKSALEYYEKALSLSPSEAERNRIEEKIVSIR